MVLIHSGLCVYRVKSRRFLFFFESLARDVRRRSHSHTTSTSSVEYHIDIQLVCKVMSAVIHCMMLMDSRTGAFQSVDVITELQRPVLSSEYCVRGQRACGLGLWKDMRRS